MAVAHSYSNIFFASALNECLSNPCQNNGKCIDKFDAFECRCQPGYGGPTCRGESKLSVFLPNCVPIFVYFLFLCVCLVCLFFFVIFFYLCVVTWMYMSISAGKSFYLFSAPDDFEKNDALLNSKNSNWRPQVPRRIFHFVDFNFKIYFS